VVLVDCVTLWVNKLMYEAEQRGDEITEADVVSRCGELLAAAAERSGAVILVTNEVGMGIVPDNTRAAIGIWWGGRTRRLPGKPRP
jgi:adenosylcobinamide kinase/adenosylcobinamide-phosphate guanylyltransferase